jgi:hypothetical protein
MKWIIDRRRLLTSLATTAALPASPLISDGAHSKSGLYRLPSPGDTLIFTTAGLIQLDTGLCANKSVEACVSELERRLGSALSDQMSFRTFIVGPKTRCFALSSTALTGSRDDLILDFQNGLERQSQFVRANFSPFSLDDLPVYIATAIDEHDRGVFEPVLDVLVYITCSSGFWQNAKICRASEVFCVAKAADYRANICGPHVVLIALWPLGAA